MIITAAAIARRVPAPSTFALAWLGVAVPVTVVIAGVATAFIFAVFGFGPNTPGNTHEKLARFSAGIAAAALAAAVLFGGLWYAALRWLGLGWSFTLLGATAVAVFVAL